MLKRHWISIAIIISVAFQISANVSLITQSREGTRADLIGFVVLMASGFFFLMFGRKSFRLDRPLFNSLTIFMLYFAASVGLNGGYSVLASTLSKYGIVTWALAGLFFRLALVNDVELFLRSRSNQSIFSTLLPWISLGSVGWFLFSLRAYAVEPFGIESYQFAAENLTVLGLMVLLIHRHLIEQCAKINDAPHLRIVLFITFALYSYAAYLVARMNSTGIVLFWIIFSIFVLVECLGLKLAASTIATVILLFFTVDFTVRFDDFAIFTETRFKEILSSESILISSATNRFNLIDNFPHQFSVNPVLGHMEAEVVAGFPFGDYVHSVPLSLLTHLGIVGFFLFCALTYRSFFQPTQFPKSDSKSIQSSGKLLLLFILLLGSFTTFFTWIPIWFLVGFHVIQPAHMKAGYDRYS